MQNIGFDLEGNGDDEEHVDNDEVDDKNDNDNDFDMNTKVPPDRQDWTSRSLGWPGCWGSDNGPG